MFTNGETREELKTMAAIQNISQEMPDLANLTLRDLFAMTAMNTIINCHTNTNLDDILNKDYYIKNIPDAAYKLADAMLEKRRQR